MVNAMQRYQLIPQNIDLFGAYPPSNDNNDMALSSHTLHV